MRIAPPDLVKVTEIFLIPNSFIVAALGTADTNLHRAAVSALGFVVSVLWWICSSEALNETGDAAEKAEKIRFPRRVRILVWLPIVFTLGWLTSLIIHAMIWNRPLGQ